MCRAARESKPLATGHGGPYNTRPKVALHMVESWRQGTGVGAHKHNSQGGASERPSEAGCAAHSLTKGRRHAISMLRPGHAARTYILTNYRARVACACPRAARSPRALVIVSCSHAPSCPHGHLRAPPDRQSPFIPYHPGLFGPLLEGLSWWKLPYTESSDQSPDVHQTSLLTLSLSVSLDF